MLESSNVVKIDNLTTDGLEQVFEAYQEPIEQGVGGVPEKIEQGAKQGVEQGAGMSLEAACLHYRLAPSTLRAKIKRGEIPATKVEGLNGPEWRVSPTGRTFINPIEQGAKQGAEHGAKDYLYSEASTSVDNVSRLLDLVDKQASKLEVASGQIGYLSSQLESYKNQVRSLPDLEAKAIKAKDQERELEETKTELDRLKGSWWYRFSRFFSGGK